MDFKEEARLIYALQAKGWTQKEVTDLVLWIQTGERDFRPKELDWLDEKEYKQRRK